MLASCSCCRSFGTVEGEEWGRFRSARAAAGDVASLDEQQILYQKIRGDNWVNIIVAAGQMSSLWETHRLCERRV
jgi:hypothetical protein